MNANKPNKTSELIIRIDIIQISLQLCSHLPGNSLQVAGLALPDVVGDLRHFFLLEVYLGRGPPAFEVLVEEKFLHFVAEQLYFW